ncbi:aminotransferase class V-fold PLP-dependent enzyme [Rhodopirellula halodulae]|uniref:aminotransferase class V-fold PLP-dependent enzyme n=1 Tax=Rhodopirellula halodulae TaxID=2894198 RepID=UPI001E53C1F9|nr:aminotransferase class V-fold PLP-dependent enzyme [Rhodopirellula sp. JC737]MCC9654249.1 aminotransferase class V-fold PLP-dependent enzyme [Rhodopirellula sp. JC737]
MSDADLKNDPWSWWRDRMPVTKKWAYFDHAAVAPISQPAADALKSFADVAASHGDVHWMDWSNAVNRLRDLTAELVQCEREEVTLVPNTTTGINLVAEGLDWKAGDNMVVPEGEFPSNLYPWLNQQSKGVEVRIVPRRDGRVEVSDLMERVDDRTRLISVSWVGYASGFRVNLNELVEQAHAKGVLVFLDAIQGLGMYPLDLQTCDVDFVAADGHKWLLGPEGAGVAIIRKRHLDRLHCSTVGWASVENAHLFSGSEFKLRGDASRFEGGSLNQSGMMSFASSLEMFCQIARHHGHDAIGNRVLERARKLRELLTQRGARLIHGPWDDTVHASAITTFEIPGETPDRFRARALETGVVVSCRGGGVRASVHVYNDDADLNRLAELVSSSDINASSPSDQN